jgi:GNAT superfamily N-acetyltransferase
VARLLTELGYEQDPREAAAKLAEWANEPHSRVLVAEEEGEVAGVLALHICPYFERPGRFGRIVALAVDRSRRRSGLGRKLVQAAESISLQLGCVDMEVTSRRTREDAAPFYRSLGYEDVCERSARFKREL